MASVQRDKIGWGRGFLKFYIIVAFVFLFLPVAVIIIFSHFNLYDRSAYAPINPNMVENKLTMEDTIMLFLTESRSLKSCNNSLLSVIISHTVFCAPFAMFIIRARLRSIHATLEEAAWDLGAGRWQTVRELILPLSTPGLIAAMLLTFTLSFDEFIIAWFVSGFQPTLPVKIWTMMRGGIKPTINAIGAIVFIFSMSVLFIGEYYLGKKPKG